MTRSSTFLSIAISWLVWQAGAASQNILLIIADDYGADSSVLYNSTNAGATLPPTPTITTLASRGVTFANAYANPVCSPTRACLITGRASFRTGIGNAIAGAGSPVLRASEFTLPEAFAANPGLGYQLAQFGKWHLAMQPNSPGNIGGWPYYAGNLSGALTNYYSWTKTINGVTTLNTNYASTEVVNDALAWIQAQGIKPWFAWVAFNAPHTPLHKPPSALCPHYATLSGAQADINAHPVSYFDAMVEAMDTEMARLLAAVSLTNTHVIFIGDNGTVGQTIQPPYPASRSKSSIYEGGTKVPLIIAGPAVAYPGRTNATPVHAIDLFATILELAGIDMTATVPANVTVDSKSIGAALRAGTNLSRFVYTEVFGSGLAASEEGRALRNDRYKLLQFYDGRAEFYDLAADPYETHNLLSQTVSTEQLANYYSLVLEFGSYSVLPPPEIIGISNSGGQVSVTVQQSAGLSYGLWRAPTLDPLAWTPVTNALVVTNGSALVGLVDTNASAGQQFYRVEAKSP